TFLAGFLTDDEHPGVRVFDVDVKRVVPLGNGKSADVEIGIGVQRGGGVRARAPYGIGAVVRDDALGAENIAAANRRRGVLDGNLLAGNRRRRLGGGTGTLRAE